MAHIIYQYGWNKKEVRELQRKKEDYGHKIRYYQFQIEKYQQKLKGLESELEKFKVQSNAITI